MSDNDELGPSQKLLEHDNEPLDVGFVQCRIDLVEHAKRAGAVLKNGKKQCNTSERLFAAAEQRDVARLLAGRPGDNLDTAFENIDPFFEYDVGVASTEELAEQALEMPLDRLQCVGKQPSAVVVDLADNLRQGLPRLVVLLEASTPVAVSPLVLPLLFGLDRRLANALWLVTTLIAIPWLLLVILLLQHL